MAKTHQVNFSSEQAELKLFGSAQYRFGQAWHSFPMDKRGALLIYLAFQADWVSRDQLAFLFWPDKRDTIARRNLRQLLNRLKSLPLFPLLGVCVDLGKKATLRIYVFAEKQPSKPKT